MIISEAVQYTLSVLRLICNVCAVEANAAFTLFAVGIASIVPCRLQKRGCRFPTFIFQTRTMKVWGLAFLGAGICTFSGCGGGPSNADIETAVKKHFATDVTQPKGMLRSVNPGFHFRFPEGFNGVNVERCSLVEVSVRKVGNGYTKSEMPGIGKLYPIRVFVKGTAHSSDGEDRIFEGDVDLQVRYMPADQSRVDSGSGGWEIWDAGH